MNDQLGAYTEFAAVYDLFMEEVPYQAWKERIVELLKEHGIHDGLILDLGCGTGTMTELLGQAGYDMIGVDASCEMLDLAMRKRESSGLDILYLCQDMREFELYGTVRAVICICDSLNYLLEKEDLIETFRLVNNYLDPKGLFVFDFNTVHKYRDVIGDRTIAENREEGSFIWENAYDEESGINEYALTFFIKDQKSGLYAKAEEEHLQRGYELEEIQDCLQKAGLTFIEAYDTDTNGAVTKDSERITVIAGECGKDNTLRSVGNE